MKGNLRPTVSFEEVHEYGPKWIKSSCYVKFSIFYTNKYSKGISILLFISQKSPGIIFFFFHSSLEYTERIFAWPCEQNRREHSWINAVNDGKNLDITVTSPHVRESGFREIFSRGIQNPCFVFVESGILGLETGIQIKAESGSQ